MIKEINFLTEPLSIEEVEKQMKEKGEIDVNIIIGMYDMIDASDDEEFEQFLDAKIVGDYFLISSIRYSAIGIHEGKIIMNVKGYIEDFEEKLQEALSWRESRKI
jgi:hypothetical protein